MIGITEIIGMNIVRLRKSSGKTQEDLARYLHITPQQVQKYESGKNNMPVAMLYEVCDFLNISIVDFLYTITVNQVQANGLDTDKVKDEKYIRKLMQAIQTIKSDTIRKAILDFITSISKNI